MTKADVLDNLETLKVCNSYNINGDETNKVPFQMEGTGLEPVYKNFKGWQKDITGIKNFENLPPEMVTYIEFINSSLGVSVNYISNGPATDQLIVAL